VNRGLRLVRRPERPGPGPMPDALLRALDLQVRRKIDGLLQGEFRATTLGPGLELAQVRRYEPGDDVRQIEWNVTARTGEPHVRVQVAEKNLTTCVVLDCSPSMTFGTADRTKADVAEGVLLALGHVATSRGNQLRTLTCGAPTQASPIVRPGRVGMLGALRELRASSPEGVPQRTLSDALHLIRAGLRPRSAVFVVSDLRDVPDLKRPLTRLAQRHDVVCVEVRDPREQELPDIGDAWFVDPESGRQMRVDTGDTAMRRRFAAAAAHERAELRRVILSAGCDHVVLSTSGDWLRALATWLKMRTRTL
jgi:uncharacterized protein (DUF58 family)